MNQHRTAAKIIAGLTLTVGLFAGVVAPAQANDTGWNGTKTLNNDTGWNGTSITNR
ncbi:hypothetical protein [Nocardioides mesophilus]|uniref:Uncharacterized protein n=1 Tax=Nocardioides mesophilus TaxID=433659 RepID=A0A7G9RG24_9ACTN|nr:hypothetical protein [Nocardioides mesophilus]QNN54549.1 hypothetical protein H9L09_09705 [Nocardioides mesophilus]